MGAVVLIQDHHGVLDFLVKKVELEVYPVHRPSLAPLHKARK